MASPASSDEPLARPKEPLTFLRLPEETQREIFSHCNQGELICLSLVSKHFRELAASQLYRNFHIVFPDEDDPAFDSPIDGLAGGLDTFTTSEYDYAKHLKDLSLDTLSAGDKAETAYKPYLYSTSCGKMMNTLLLMTLRKATSLERFRWNIRVELSRPVYRALHQLDSLNHLHIRMQAGSSLFEIPPPLPLAVSTWPTNHSYSTIPPPMNPGLFNNAFSPAQPLMPPLPAVPKCPGKTRGKALSVCKEPPTLSAFKKLRSLAILDMDTLDIVTEVKSCIRNSAPNLTKLKLSFSDALASQARKPSPENDPDDSDPDDEFQVVPVPQNSGYDASAPAKAFKAQEERKTQETVLGRMLDVEPFLVKKMQDPVKSKSKEDATRSEKSEPTKSIDLEFADSIKIVSAKILKTMNGGSSDLQVHQQEILSMIEFASKRYIESDFARKALENEKNHNHHGNQEPPNENASSSSGTVEPASTAPDPSAASIPSHSGNETPANGAGAVEGVDPATQSSEPYVVSSLFEPKPSKLKEHQDVRPEDIVIEESGDVDDSDDQTITDINDTVSMEPTADDGSALACKEDTTTNIEVNGKSSAMESKPASGNEASSSAVEKAKAMLSTQRSNLEALVKAMNQYQGETEQLADSMKKWKAEPARYPDEIRLAEKLMSRLGTNMDNIKREIQTLNAEIIDVRTQLPDQLASSNSPDALNRRISEYIKSTRGLALEELAIHLIPVKASVLSRAVDIHVLKRITLLNVGSQAPIWTLLAKENKVQPLALRKIFTDNVSQAFLTFVSQLERVEELFLLERSIKYKPESFAAKTTVTIEHIRRFALRKHLPSLTGLMIKNDSGSSWDFDEKTTLLVCNRAPLLEELAVSMGIRAIHILLQNISGLTQLRALNIIHFRNDDTCVWVMRETRRFIVDNLAHYPNLKLEWISIDDDRAERIIRSPDTAAKPAQDKKKKKGKDKALTPASTPMVMGTSLMNDTFPLLPTDAWDSASDSDDDDDEIKNSKLETHENVRFYDVWGVRIFRKEVMNGRL